MGDKRPEKRPRIYDSEGLRMVRNQSACAAGTADPVIRGGKQVSVPCRWKTASGSAGKDRRNPNR